MQYRTQNEWFQPRMPVLTSSNACSKSRNWIYWHHVCKNLILLLISDTNLLEEFLAVFQIWVVGDVLPNKAPKNSIALWIFTFLCCRLFHRFSHFPRVLWSFSPTDNIYSLALGWSFFWHGSLRSLVMHLIRWISQRHGRTQIIFPVWFHPSSLYQYTNPLLLVKA